MHGKSTHSLQENSHLWGEREDTEMGHVEVLVFLCPYSAQIISEVITLKAVTGTWLPFSSILVGLYFSELKQIFQNVIFRVRVYDELLCGKFAVCLAYSLLGKCQQTTFLLHSMSNEEQAFPCCRCTIYPEIGFSRSWERHVGRV